LNDKSLDFICHFLGGIFHWAIGYMNLGLRGEDNAEEICLTVHRVGVGLEVTGMY